MSGVVLRCPNCGTTKATEGECDACHEADVRYFCTNHAPGQWLETPRCPACGARFGESAPPARPAAEEGPTLRRPGRRASPPRPAPMPVEDAPEPPGPWTETRMAEEERRRRAIREAVLTRLPDLLRRPRRREAISETVYPEPELVPAGLMLGGCLFRAVGLMLFLFVMLFFGALLLGGAFFPGFGVFIF